MGPSGSGKSTLLHLLGGLERPTAGTLELFVPRRGGARLELSKLGDEELARLRRTTVGFVFQEFHLLPTLSAEENVALPLLLDRRRPRDVRERVQAALDLVGLGHRRRHRPDELSGGEMQRVAIARALVIDPALILADEPTGNLDTRTGEQILALIRDANRARGSTVVLVTHDARAAGHAARIVTLKDGTVVNGAPA
jgi:putative ABC transport system ATP-binding protein